MNELVKVNEGSLELAEEILNEIVNIEGRIKELTECQKKYKETILRVMEENDLLGFENEIITITRRAATTKETIDSKLLRAELPDVYDAYARISNVKGSITIKVK